MTVSIPQISSDYALNFLGELRDTVLISLFYKVDIPDIIFTIYKHPTKWAWPMLVLFSICWLIHLNSSNKFKTIKFYVMIGLVFFINFLITILLVNKSGDKFLTYAVYIYSILTLKYFYDFLSIRLLKIK